MPDWLDDLSPDAQLQWASFVQHFRRDAAEKIAGSAAMVSIASDHPDPKLAMELGYGILLDKPIVVVVPEGVRVSDKLAHVADAVVELDIDTKEGAAKLASALRPFIEQTQKET